MKYCFDLDGTLCTITPQYADAQPIQAHINIVNRLFDAGHEIVIDTARAYVYKTRLEEIESLTRDQLRKWGVKHHELRVGQKVNADIYVDDKGITALTFFTDFDE